MPEGNKIDLSEDGGVLKEILEEGKGTETHSHFGCFRGLRVSGIAMWSVKLKGVQRRRGSFEGATQEDLKARICKETPKSRKEFLYVSGIKRGV